MATELETVVGGKKRLPLWLKCVIGVVVLCILYFLSFGPVWWFETHGHLKQHRRISKMVSLFYKPLFWAYDHTPLRRPIELYSGLWGHAHHDKKAP